jgi:hypothetical protein
VSPRDLLGLDANVDVASETEKQRLASLRLASLNAQIVHRVGANESKRHAGMIVQKIEAKSRVVAIDPPE